jgi:hypothetical protein
MDLLLGVIITLWILISDITCACKKVIRYFTVNRKEV